MGRFYRLAIVALAAIAGSALLVASTGSGATGAKRGGTLKLISSGDVDSVDPGQTYYSYGWEILTAVHRTLYATPANSVKTIPDLAVAAPKISADGKTVTVRIKKGVRFGPPVNREVTSADVKYAIERSFSVSVTNGYVILYFSNLVGYPAKPPKTPKPVSGIKTPNKYTIVFKLKQPGTTLASALVMTNTAPVPKEYAAKYDNKTTSDYGFYQAATGPYMFEANERRKHQGRGVHARPLDEARAQPELVSQGGLPACVRGRDRGQGRVHRHSGRRSPDPQRHRGRRRRLRGHPRTDPEAAPDEREVRGQPLLLAERHRLPHAERARRSPSTTSTSGERRTS